MATANNKQNKRAEEGPACPSHGNPNGLISLLAMYRFQAHHFVAISNTLGQAMMELQSERIPQDRTMGAIGSSCGLLLKHCEELELVLAAAHIKRFGESLNEHSYYRDMHSALLEIQQRVWDELESSTLFALAQGDARYYADGNCPPIVLERFPDATFDITEAGKCLALDRPTACVFHLMRVTEYGLQAIGKVLGMNDPRPNWEPVIAKIDSDLKLPFKERKSKDSTDLLANISAQMHAVKIAWRNRVMHVEKKHTPEEARDIYSATCALMRYLAETLPQEKSGGVVQAIRGIIGT
jgi:hypothetical protein